MGPRLRGDQETSHVAINRDIIGKEYPPFEVRVEGTKIREFALALRDENPLHLDERSAAESRYGALVAPPTFTRNFWWEGFGVHDDLGFGSESRLHGQQEFEYFRPLKAGDRLTAIMRIADVYEKEGRRGGRMTFAVVETEFRDPEGDLVLIGRRTLIDAEKAGTTKAEPPRAGRRITSAGEVDVGSEPEPLVVGPLTRTDLVRYAGASGDLNPIHHDDVYAIRAGNERVFAMGMLPGGHLGRLLEEWLGEESLRRFRIRFTAKTWPGDTLTCRARIRDKRNEEGAWIVDCDAWVDNQYGRRVVDGEAVARLP